MIMNKEKDFDSQIVSSVRRIWSSATFDYKVAHPQPKAEDLYTPDECVSCTVPDQSYTIDELLRRYTSGTLPPVIQNGVYDSDSENFDDDVDLTPLERNDLDRFDKAEYLRSVQTRIDESARAKRLIEEKTRKEQEAKTAKENAEFEAFRKEEALQRFKQSKFKHQPPASDPQPSAPSHSTA
jgi:hypothetical protein